MDDETQLRILIVDDDPKLTQAVEATLQSDGRFLVIGCATSGEEALRVCEQVAPDVVLMDIGMPGLDGIDTTRAIHERDSGQHVVIYTGSEEYEDVARADEAGASGYLHKSVLTSPDLADALLVLHANYVGNVPDPE